MSLGRKMILATLAFPWASLLVAANDVPINLRVSCPDNQTAVGGLCVDSALKAYVAEMTVSAGTNALKVEWKYHSMACKTTNNVLYLSGRGFASGNGFWQCNNGTWQFYQYPQVQPPQYRVSPSVPSGGSNRGNDDDFSWQFKG